MANSLPQRRHRPKPSRRTESSLFDLLDMGSWDMDFSSGNIRFSSAACRIASLQGEVHSSREALMARVLNTDRQRIATAWRAGLTSGVYEAQYRLFVDGNVKWVWEKAQIEFDEDGVPTRAHGALQDISRHRQAETELFKRANYDQLTGLPNRNLLCEHLGRTLSIAKRCRQQLAVLFVDLDRFKLVNDRLGHNMGDKLLKQAAQRMKACLRESDMVSRHGGDEFIVVLHDIAHEAYAGLVALKLIEAISHPYRLDGKELHIGASVGISLFPTDAENAETLFHDADMAMYRAKESGRNTLCFFDPTMVGIAIQRQRLESDLRDAMQRGEFALHYQPIVDIQSGKLAGVEALIRWNHPRNGLMSPDTFIPTAEEVGLIRDIGRWVVTEVCRQQADWRSMGIDVYTSVNVSGRQIPDGLPLDWLEHALSAYGVSTDRIVFEITENTLLQDTPKTRHWLEAVRKLGIKLFIDDFGTGFSSLGYLRHFRMDSMKIDKSFVLGMQRDPRMYSLVKSIIAIGSNLDMSIVAEGIENEEAMGQLRELGCDYAQGYHLFRPLTAEGVGQLFGTPGTPEAIARQSAPALPAARQEVS